MQFLHHRFSTSTNARWIKKLELGDFSSLDRHGQDNLHMPHLAEAPSESLDAVVEELLDHTNSNENIARRLAPLPQLPSVMPALPTMYTANNQIDFDAQANLMRELAGQGIRGFVVMGTTGESALVTFEEHEAAVKHAIETAREISMDIGENIRIVAGSGANWTAEQKHLAHRSMNMKADATLLLPPYYVKEQSEANMIRHFWRALDEGPGIVYRVSSRTNIDISEEVIAHLSRHPNFVGVKECEGRVGSLTQMFDAGQEGHKVWSGEDFHVVRDREQGAAGAISVTANVHPELVLSANESSRDNRVNRAAEYLTELTFKFGNPSTVHSIAEMVRQANGEDHIRGFRLPARALISAQRQWLISGLERVGVQNLANFDDSLVRNFDRMS